jgi:Na+/H+ antiporter NhaD/arsenite permease-like protein
MQEILALGLFIVVLAFIAFELAHRTVLALLGAAILVAFGVLGQERAASEFVDWNTIGLLAGMMVIVVILEKTGVFEYLAIKSAQRARPDQDASLSCFPWLQPSSRLFWTTSRRSS